MEKVVIIYGGVSAEHEVSIITGLQVIEKIDKTKFETYAIKLGQDGIFYYYPGLKNRADYMKVKPVITNFGRDVNGAYFLTKNIIGKRIYPEAAYLACHGGNGESGQLQGFLEILGIPFTSPGVESSAISMNKTLTKQVLESQKISTVPWMSILAKDIRENVNQQAMSVEQKLKLPVIVKPVHLGSSIGLEVARTKIELKKALLAASFTDTEILIEKYLTGFKEFNISICDQDGKLLLSEIEQPKSKDEILSFADKYQRGGKKSGGMASLSRELPARVSSKLKLDIQNIAKNVYKAIRAKGRLRIDFIYTGSKLFPIEVNPIPGSMAYYLWEAGGTSFKDQITQDFEACIANWQFVRSLKLKYQSDIVEKFVHQKTN